MACEVRTVKLSVIGLSCIQKLIAHDAVSPSALNEIFSMLKNVSYLLIWPFDVVAATLPSGYETKMISCSTENLNNNSNLSIFIANNALEILHVYPSCSMRKWQMRPFN